MPKGRRTYDSCDHNPRMTPNGTELFRRLGAMLLALGAALVIVAMPATGRAQNYDVSTRTDDATTQSDTAPPSRQETEQAARRAAADQVSTTTSETRYTPDKIDLENDTTRSSRTSNRFTPQDENGDETRRSSNFRRPPTPPSEFETYVSQIVDKPLRRFGANLLVPSARDFTVPATTTVPPNYRINPGDELVVGLTGSVYADNLRLVVDNDGQIFVPRVGALVVGGVRYGDLPQLLSQRISRVYRGFQVNVTVGRLRGITVYVTGFAATPGSYTVSSLSTLVNAVLAAGGPSSGGSFRSIQLRRGGELVSDFDLYDLLLKGDKSGDAVLQNGDVIYIAPAGAQVAVIGSVNNEAIFEARPKDTLQDILLYAGGVSTVADDRRLLVLDPIRLDTGGWEELTPTQVQSRLTQRGEIVRVLSAIGIARPLSQQPVLVTVSGEVAKPGRYYVPAGSRLDAIVSSAGGLTAQAYPYASVVTRESVRAQQRLSYDRAIREMELLLTTQPLINANASATGAIQPQQLELVRSLVDQLCRREPDGRIVLDIAPDANALTTAMTLENNDTIYVPPRPVTIGVFGAVPSPASFEYQPGMTIGEVLRKAGGVQQIGDKSHIYVIRANGSILPQHGGSFSGNISHQRAQPGDLVFVPIDADRGLFWQRLRDITTTLFSGAVAAATVVAVTK